MRVWQEIEDLDPAPGEWDRDAFRRITSETLTPEQAARVVQPALVLPGQEAVIAVHWHPEFVPFELIQRRIDGTFPNRASELIIPTQHNVLLALHGYAGVEVDCFSPAFNRKVQLLIHFREERVREATVFRSMLAHTFRYRTSQLYEFIDSVLDPRFDERVAAAAELTGASAELVRFARAVVARLRRLLDLYEAETPLDMIKNRLVFFYLDAFRDLYDPRLIAHAHTFLRAVKQIVKENFALDYFYRTEQVIEEARRLGGGIVIPHPEQFWPILLADYDVDGIEVWNPQSRQYTEFLINCVFRQNRTTRRGQRPLLIFMGDDTHMGEKVLPPNRQDREKSNREIGVQPAWDDMLIRKSLIIADVSRERTIREYRARLDG